MEYIINTNFFDGSPDLGWLWAFFVAAVIATIIWGLFTIYAWSSDSEISSPGAAVITVLLIGAIAGTTLFGIQNVNDGRAREAAVKSELVDGIGLENFRNLPNAPGNQFIGTTISGRTVLCTAYNVGRDTHKLVCSR